jgi:RNA polymerase sigma-70 factor (ECF subfamily)
LKEIKNRQKIERSFIANGFHEFTLFLSTIVVHATFLSSFMSLELASAMDDITLVSACTKGDSRAQRALFDKFAPKMLSICKRYIPNGDESEDVLQDAFVKIFQKIGDFKQEGSLEGWMRRIVVNTALDAIRKNKKWLGVAQVETVENQVSFDDSAFDNMDVNHLLQMINDMPDGYRVVFNMFAIEGYSHKEIADTLGVSENTSKSQYSRARAFLRTQIEQLESEK